MNVENLIALRFIDRNIKFSASVESLKRTQNGKGALFSGSTVKLGYDQMVSEFKGSSDTILSSLSDSIVGFAKFNATEFFSEIAQSALSSRKFEIENIYQELTNPIFSQLGNREALKQYFDLSSVYELVAKELEISVNKLKHEYKKSLGKTLFEQVKNQFLNKPLVVITVITISTVTTVLAFMAILGINFKS